MVVLYFGECQWQPPATNRPLKKPVCNPSYVLTIFLQDCIVWKSNLTRHFNKSHSNCVVILPNCWCLILLQFIYHLNNIQTTGRTKLFSTYFFFHLFCICF